MTHWYAIEILNSGCDIILTCKKHFFLPDNESEASSSNAESFTSSSSRIEMTSTMTSTPVDTFSVGRSSTAVAATVTVLVLLVFIIAVVIIIILYVILKKRRMKYSNNLTSIEQTGGSSKKNNYTLKLGPEYEEMDDLDDKSATLSNKDSGHHNASTTCEDVEHGEKKGLVPSTNVTSGYEDIDEISSKNSRYYKSPMKGDIPAGGSDNVTADAESQIYN